MKRLDDACNIGLGVEARGQRIDDFVGGRDSPQREYQARRELPIEALRRDMVAKASGSATVRSSTREASLVASSVFPAGRSPGLVFLAFCVVLAPEDFLIYLLLCLEKLRNRCGRDGSLLENAPTGKAEQGTGDFGKADRVV